MLNVFQLLRLSNKVNDDFKLVFPLLFHTFENRIINCMNKFNAYLDMCDFREVFFDYFGSRHISAVLTDDDWKPSEIWIVSQQ